MSSIIYMYIRLYIANTMPLDGLVCMSEHLIARTYILPTTTCILHVYILHVLHVHVYTCVYTACALHVYYRLTDTLVSSASTSCFTKNSNSEMSSVGGRVNVN